MGQPSTVTQHQPSAAVSAAISRPERYSVARGSARVSASRLVQSAPNAVNRWCSGSLGGTLGMFCFHHKTKHWYFRYGFPILLVVQLLLLGAGAYLLLR